jgi:hypothetical protein
MINDNSDRIVCLRQSGKIVEFTHSKWNFDISTDGNYHSIRFTSLMDHNTFSSLCSILGIFSFDFDQAIVEQATIDQLSYKIVRRPESTLVEQPDFEVDLLIHFHSIPITGDKLINHRKQIDRSTKIKKILK